MKAQIKALMDAIESGKIKSDKAEIFSIIMASPLPITEHLIMARMKETTMRATIVGRVSELMDLGVVKVKGTYKDETKSMYVYVSNVFEQSRLREKRKKERKDRWIKSGLRLGFIGPIDILNIK